MGLFKNPWGQKSEEGDRWFKNQWDKNQWGDEDDSSLTAEPSEIIMPNFLSATDIAPNRRQFVRRYPSLRIASISPELQGGNQVFELNPGPYHQMFDGQVYYYPGGDSPPSLLLYDSNLIGPDDYTGSARGGYWSVPGYKSTQRFVFYEKIGPRGMPSARGNARRPVISAIALGGGATTAATFGTISVEVIGNNINPGTLSAINEIAASLTALYPTITITPVPLSPAQIEENVADFPADRIAILLDNADLTINVLTSATYSGWVFR